MSSQNMNTKRPSAWKFLRTLIVLALIAAGGYFGWQYTQQKAAEATLAKLETAPLARETLTSSISGTGTLRAHRLSNLVWQTSGTIGSIEAAVGASVSEGDVLMAIDPDKLPLDILQAKSDQIRLQESLDMLDADTALQRTKLQADIAAAEKAITDLQQQLDLLDARTCTEWNLRNRQDDYDEALKNYQDNPSEWFASRLEQARQLLDFCKPETLLLSKNELTGQLAFQQENLVNLRQSLDKIKDGPDPQQKSQFELQLEMAERRLQFQEITAPFNGTVVSLSGEVGDLVNTGTPALTVADLAHLYVDVPISEVDIPQVALGQPVDLVFDSYFEETFKGEVTEIAEVAQELGNVVNYMVRVELISGVEKVRPGMTAGVSIMVGEKPGILVVPSQSIASLSGDEVVYVLKDGFPVAVPVTLGLYSQDKVEITSGDVNEGDLIILNPPSGLIDMMANRMQR